MSVEAYYLICDEAQVSIASGKLSLHGLYNGEIRISLAEQVAGQLVFYFVIGCDIKERPSELTLEVTLPGEEAKTYTLSIMPAIAPPDRRHWGIQVPFAMMQPVLRPGKITGRVLFDGRERAAISGPWITLTPGSP